VHAEEEVEETQGEGHYQKPYKKIKKDIYKKKKRGGAAKS
jgi:hypothetical protein